MRPKNLGFEDCDIIPYCRIVEPNTQCDSQNSNKNSKTLCKLPIPRDLDTDKLKVETNSNNKTKCDSEKETIKKPNISNEVKLSLEPKSNPIECDSYSPSSPKYPSDFNSITESDNSEHGANECKDKHCNNNNRDENSNNSSTVKLPLREKNCHKKLCNEKCKICLQNKDKVLGSTRKTIKEQNSENSCKINNDTSSLDRDKVKVKCSSNSASDCSDCCSSICPHFKNTKKCCLPNFCNDCKKIYESILSSINSPPLHENSDKNCIKSKQYFEENKKKICKETEGDQSSQLEIEERKISYEDLCANSSEKTSEICSETSSQINESFCNDSNKNNGLKEDSQDQNLNQSVNNFENCSDYSSKEQDSRENCNEEVSRRPVIKKKCDCKDRKYCKINSGTVEDKGENSSDRSNSVTKQRETVLNCPAWKQSYEDSCKGNKKLNQFEKHKSCSEQYVNNNNLESNLNSSNTNKNIVKQDEISKKQLSESLKEKKCVCKRANENEDLQKLYKEASNKQIEKKKCCCKNKNKDNPEENNETGKPTDITSGAKCEIDLCGKKIIKECPRKKQSFEDFCKEKQKLIEDSDDVCSNKQIRCGMKPQEVEHKHFFRNKIDPNDLTFNWSVSDHERIKTVYPLKKEVDLKESILINEIGTNSSSNIMSESVLLLKIRNPLLRGYFEARENGSIYSSSASSTYPETISHVYSQSSVSVELKVSQLFQNSFCSDNNIKCISAKLDKGNEEISSESFRENNVFETKHHDKWSEYLLQIQSESDEELCRQYDEYLRQEEEFKNSKLNTSLDYSMSSTQSDYLFNMSSTKTSSSDSTQNLSLNLEVERLPSSIRSSIPVTVEGPLKSNNNEIENWNNCLSMPSGPNDINNSANKSASLESFQSTMESDTGTRKCFTNPIKLQATSNNSNTGSLDSTEFCCKNEDYISKVTINRLNSLEENDHNLSQNEDQLTKERSIILSSKISFIDKETLKAFAEAHDHTMTTIKTAMQDLADTIHKNTSEVALSAVTRIQSETTKPIEIIKNYQQSEASSQIKKYIEENAEKKVKIIMNKINELDNCEQPFYEKIYLKASEVLKSTMLVVEESALRKITLSNFNDQSSVYDVPNPNLDKKCSKVEDIAHVVNSNPLTNIFTKMTAKFLPMFTRTKGCEENISFKVSETSICSNLSESDTESEEDVD